MNIIKLNSPNQFGRNGWKPDVIVCHITDGSYTGAVGWLRNKISRVSSHYVVSRKGEISQLVDITAAAWTQGLYSWQIKAAKSTLVKQRAQNPNLYCISIEFEGIYAKTHGALAPEQIAAAIQLIAHIRQEVKTLYEIDIPINRTNIIGHCDVNPIGKPSCPGEMFPFDTIINALESPAESPKVLQVNSKVQLSNAPLFISSYSVKPVRTISGVYVVSRVIIKRPAGILINTNLGWVRQSDCSVI